MPRPTTHLIPNPNGSYSFVGAVPLALMLARKPTLADVMGGRVHDGVAYIGRSWLTLDAALAAAYACRAPLCDLADCACRKLY